MTTPDSLGEVLGCHRRRRRANLNDRLWFFLSARNQGSYRTISGMHANLNAGDPAKWTYAPDSTRPAQSARAAGRSPTFD